MKPNCYKCKHRGTLPGSAHSRCRHPSNDESEDPLLEMLGIFASVGRTPPMQLETGLNVKGNPHGIASGWFNWPWSYDPVWLVSCDGWESKNEVLDMQNGEAQPDPVVD